MKLCLLVLEFTILSTVSRAEVPVNGTVLAKGCTPLYCYHILSGLNIPSSYRKQGRLWPGVPQLQEICLERVSPGSWLLEIYDSEEQLFVEEFVSAYIPDKTSLHKDDPVLVPLYLNVTFRDGWSWLNGNEARGLPSRSGDHYAYVSINRSSALLEATSSDLPNHFGLCHIPRMHCKELRSSFVVDGRCFYKVKERLTWHQSRLQCHKRRGELSSVIPGFYLGFSDQTLRRTSPSSVRIQGDLWVGLTDVEERWLKRNHSAVYTNWGGDPVDPFRGELDFAFLEMDSRKWSATLPHNFQLKVVCMTNNNNNNNNNNVDDDDDDTKNRLPTQQHFIDTCRTTTTWLIMATVVTSLVALTIGIFYAKERLRFSFRPAERFRQREDLAVLQPFGGSQEDGLESLSYPNGILVDKHDVIVN